MTNTVTRTAAALALAAVMVLGVSAAANAAAQNGDIALSQQSVPTIAPGGTGTIKVDVFNDGPQVLDGNAVFQPLTIVAPTNTTFTTASFARAMTQTGQTATMSSCTLSADKRTIACPIGQWTSGSTSTGKIAELTLSVLVDVAAPPSSTLTGGSITWTRGATNGDTWTDSNEANNTNVPLSVKTSAVVPTPAIDPVIAVGVIAVAAVAAVAASSARVIRRRR